MRILQRDSVVVGLFFTGILTALVALHVWSANMKAAAYERVTGKKVSAWDAMFLDLRVQEEPK